MALAVAASGCATIVRGTTENVTITANPPNAQIRTSLGQGCPQSPCIIQVDRKLPFVAYAEAPGYQPGQIMIGTGMSGGGTVGMVGNVIAGGVIGIGVDAASGATLDHSPNPAHIELVPIQTSAPPPPAQPARRRQPVIRQDRPVS